MPIMALTSAMSLQISYTLKKEYSTRVVLRIFFIKSKYPTFRQKTRLGPKVGSLKSVVIRWSVKPVVSTQPLDVVISRQNRFFFS